MLISSPAKFLHTVLLVDAATCVATGTLMALGADILAEFTAIPGLLLRYAGISLFPVAAFIALVATYRLTPAAPLDRHRRQRAVGRRQPAAAR
jgi:hypothetical protein